MKQMTYFFKDKEAQSVLADYCEPSSLFCFDFDGTLAPLVEHPSDVCIPLELRHRLMRLSKVATIAVISGRRRSDLKEHIDAFAHYARGNHGSEDDTNSGIKPVVSSWQKTLSGMIESLAGSWLEEKGHSLSVHYRQAEDHESARERLLALFESLQPSPVIVGGKFVFNLIPQGAPTKSQALLKIMDTQGFQKAIFIGDDVNDEDVYRLKDPRILGIKIGVDQPSQARYVLKHQFEVKRFLDECLSCLSSAKVPKKNLITPLFG